MHSMVCYGRRHSFVVTLGSTGRETFQIVADKDWNKRLHPDVKNANPFTPHELKGPEHDGSGYNWAIGRHQLDWAAPGNCFEVRLLLRDEVPVRVEWVRL